MKYFLILTLLFSFGNTSFAQKAKKSFTGMLQYKIVVADTSLRDLVPENKMIVYTNDTIVRIENFTSQLGKQVTIRHMVLNKSYLLLDMPFGKFAIQTDNSEEDTTAINPEKKYTVDTKCRRRKILGRKANRAEVSHKGFETPVEFLYLKDYSSQILNSFEDLPGLPVKYSIVTPDAIFNYELTKMSEYSPDSDLFGIPSDYQKISFEEFMDQLIESKAGMTPDN